MIRLRVKDRHKFHKQPLYLGQYLNKIHHTGIESACVFKTYDDAVFAIKDWIDEVYPMTGMNIYEVEEV